MNEMDSVFIEISNEIATLAFIRQGCDSHHVCNLVKVERSFRSNFGIKSEKKKQNQRTIVTRDSGPCSQINYYHFVGIIVQRNSNCPRPELFLYFLLFLFNFFSRVISETINREINLREDS
jgi:hypothetical protein